MIKRIIMRRRRKKSTLKPEHHHEIKYLIEGTAVGLLGKTLVAIPDKFEGKKVRVHFRDMQMVIPKVGKDYAAYREFDDKYGRDQHYRLIYYEWKPMSEDEVMQDEAERFLI